MTPVRSCELPVRAEADRRVEPALSSWTAWLDAIMIDVFQKPWLALNKVQCC